MSDEHYLPNMGPESQPDALVSISELRAAVRHAPHSAENRLKLSQSLYQIGDLDAAIDEARVAIKWKPDDAKAHLHLGIILMAKQDWRAALSVLKEATRLDPDLVQAHYSLGNVQYSLGNSNNAIQSYRRVLELHPHFHDAEYRLGLLLKLSNQPHEAARLMEAAAKGGIPQAQFFFGNAFKSGQGVEKNLGLAVFWWMRAMDFGHQPAGDALSKLRRQALSSKQTGRAKKDALEAFRSYRDKLWEEFPEYTRTDDEGTVGTKLLHENRPAHALPVLLQEGYALSGQAQEYLANLYESGWDQYLTPFDQRILLCLEITAADGFIPAKRFLARIYGKGLGVEQDIRKAKNILQGLPKQEIKSILAELDAF
ncbi:tetratricopeptide repeat protein [Petrachloros mirabilis]